jgi:hypothetical protein
VVEWQGRISAQPGDDGLRFAFFWRCDVEVVREWLPLVVGVVVFAVATTGLALALRTESGRESLAAGAVRLALAMLRLAERWLGRQMEPEGTLARRVESTQRGDIVTARRSLEGWLARR